MIAVQAGRRWQGALTTGTPATATMGSPTSGRAAIIARSAIRVTNRGLWVVVNPGAVPYHLKVRRRQLTRDRLFPYLLVPALLARVLQFRLHSVPSGNRDFDRAWQLIVCGLCQRDAQQTRRGEDR